MESNKNKNIAIAGIVAIVALLFAHWVSSVGRLHVSVSDIPTQGGFKYTLYKRDGSKAQEGTTKDGSLSKTLHKGVYQMLVESRERSEFRLVNVGGFLKKTTVSSKLVEEKSREFVGDNPGFCAHYTGSTLFSYDCAEPGGLRAHVPATTESPTFTNSENTDENEPLNLVGFIDTDRGTKAVVNYTGDGGHGGGAVVLYDIDQDLNTNNLQVLNGIDLVDSEMVLPYSSGFVIYTKDFSKIRYYASTGAQPTLISGIKPPKGIDKPRELTTSGEQLGALFNSPEEDGDSGLESNKSQGEDLHEKGKSAFVFYNGGSRSYEFDKPYTSGGLCGTDKLCLLLGGTLDIYDVSKGGPLYQFSMKDVQRAFSHDGTFVVATGQRLLVISEEDYAGSVAMSYGRGKFCGLNPASDGYILCLLNQRDKSAALHVSDSQPNTDSIDKRVANILLDQGISDVSIFKNVIYITPDLGELVYRPDLHGYDYDPATRKAAADNIRALVQKNGIDQGRYTIINPNE